MDDAAGKAEALLLPPARAILDKKEKLLFRPPILHSLHLLAGGTGALAAGRIPGQKSGGSSMVPKPSGSCLQCELYI